MLQLQKEDLGAFSVPVHYLVVKTGNLKMVHKTDGVGEKTNLIDNIQLSTG